jgi:hypothetical protein
MVEKQEVEVRKQGDEVSKVHQLSPSSWSRLLQALFERNPTSTSG